MSFQRLIILVSIYWVLMVMSCSRESSPVAGGTSETTNGIAACILTSDETPAANAIVRLRPSDYLAPPPRLSKRTEIISADTRTDDEGRFTFTDLTPGEYYVEITDSSSSVILLSCTIGEDDTVNLGTETLQPFSSIVGKVDSVKEGTYIQIRGLERLVATDATGHFSIDNLPAGSLNLRTETSTGKVSEISGVRVKSGETTRVAVLPQWRHAKPLRLNTTASGADISEDVFSFPLLVRLDSSNFTFLQAQDSGQDIRFTNPDGTILSHEIEKWNPATKTAAIWVNLDTIYGNNDTQSFFMHWGNESAHSTSDGAAVFDTAMGFRGVFHLNDTANLYDASSNLANGTNYNARNAAGITGGALEFVNGQETYVMYPHKDNLDAASLLENPGGCTFSWWMFPYEDLDTIANGQRRSILAKGLMWNGDTDQDWAIFTFEDTLLLEGHTELDPRDPHWTAAGNRPTSWEARRWYHVACTYDGNSVQWYINGEPDGAPVPFDHDFNTSDDKQEISIGRHHDTYPVEGVFDGLLDEIRIANVHRQPAWIKLNYVNQKEDNPLVEF